MAAGSGAETHQLTIVPVPTMCPEHNWRNRMLGKFGRAQEELSGFPLKGSTGSVADDGLVGEVEGEKSVGGVALPCR